jgi:hypothetical protein
MPRGVAIADEKRYQVIGMLSAMPADASKDALLAEISEVSGIPMSSVQEIARQSWDRVCRPLRDYNRGYHARLMADRAVASLERMTPAADSKTWMHLSISHGILFDKLQILQGLPTEIHAHLESKSDDLAELAQRLKAEAIERARAIDVTPRSIPGNGTQITQADSKDVG